MTWILWSLAYAGDCAPLTPEALQGSLAAADKAYDNLDTDAFYRTLSYLDRQLPCLLSPIGGEVAAELHLMSGVAAHADGAPNLAEGHFRGAHRAAPEVQFSKSVPNNHEVREVHRVAVKTTGPSKKARRPRRGALYVDGHPGRTIFPQHAFVVQLVDAEGDALMTQLVKPGERLPRYDLRPRDRNRLFLAAGGLAAMGIASFAAGFATRATFKSDKPGDLAELQRLRARSNLFAGVGTAFLAASAGTAVVGISIGHR